jgi:peptidyl-prolyl cis-trans isomerase B (cyclophilin B)
MAQPTYPGYYAPPTNTMAIVSLILAFIVPIAGAIVGHIAINQIKRTGEGGHGLALAGVIVGWVYTGLTVLFVIGYGIFLAVVFSHLSQTNLSNFG